jgi:hypothetical protein
MATNRTVSFAEFRQVLTGLGYRITRSETAWVFHHSTEGLLVFRLYAETEPVDEGDLRSTRRFLDLRGLIAAKDFDASLGKSAAPA